jgi:hypothetical protein
MNKEHVTNFFLSAQPPQPEAALLDVGFSAE